MLAISRYPGEAIVVDGKTRIRIHKVQGDKKVRLEIDAPPDVVVDREEIHVLKMQQQTKDAAPQRVPA